MQLAVVALLGLGLVMVHSAGMTIGGASPGPMQWLIGRPTLYAIAAIVAMMIASRLDVRYILRGRGLTNPLVYLIVASLVLVALALVPGLGRTVNGASRWLYLGPRAWGLSFQPSEIAKWTLPIAIAWWCARRQATIRSLRRGLLPPLALVGVACVLIGVEDLGTAALVGAVAVVILFAGGVRWWQLTVAVLTGAAAVVWAIMQSPYRWNRLLAFQDPWADPSGSGYHPIQSMLAVAMGGPTGRGLGGGIQKFGYLPEDTTDFVFAVICEELGMAGAALVVVLYLVLLWVGLSIVRECKDTFGRLLALGVLLTLGMQAVINLAVVTVLMPTKGIALPLVSAGGTGWVLTAFALGLVVALGEANMAEEQEHFEHVDPTPEPVVTISVRPPD